MHRIHRTVMPAASNETRFRKLKRPTNKSIPVKKKYARIYFIGESGSIHQPESRPKLRSADQSFTDETYTGRRFHSLLISPKHRFPLG